MQEKNFPVLVVDDEKNILKYYHEILGDDYQLLTAESGKDAFKIFRDNSDIGVVLTDVLMENKIAGIELINNILNVKPLTQFIIISAAHDDSFVALQTVKGIASLPKPIEPMHLKMAVKSAFKRYKEAIWIDEQKTLMGKSPWPKNT